jgi:uncharacterized delta-60 repeat protein
VVRLNTNGSVDANFNWKEILSQPTEIALQPDGKLLVGGFAITNNFHGSLFHGRLARLNPDGSVDTDFAPSVSDPWIDAFRDILVQQDGKIVVVMESGVIRLNPDGTRDASFGTTVAPGGEPYDRVWIGERLDGAVLTAGNGIVAFGDIQHIDSICLFDDCESANLVFLNANGQFEGKASRLKKLSWDPSTYAMTRAVLPLSDGGLLVAGPITRDNSPLQFDLVRLRPVPVMQSIKFSADGNASISIGGEPAWIYRIETSTDLVNWTLLRELPSAGAITQFQDPAPASQTRRFYRAALKP